MLDWARELAAEGLTAGGFPPGYGGQGDPAANVIAFETLAFGDLSLLVNGSDVQQLQTTATYL